MRRRRRRSALLGGLVAVALAGAGIWSIAALSGNDMVEAAVTQAKSLADLIGQRSPGARTEAMLTKTKHAKTLARHRQASAPHARHEAAVPPKLAITDIAKLLEAPPPVLAPPAATPFPQVALTAPAPSLGGIIAPPGSSGGTMPGGSGGGSPGGGTTPSSFPGPESKVPVSVPSAVPEPATWAMMLFGFGLIGWRIRLGRTKGGAIAA